MKSNIDSEKLVERKLVDGCKFVGGLSIKLLSNHFVGLPDRMCLFPNGRIVFVELKTTYKKPTKIQLHVHSLLRKLGFRVEVVDSLHGVISLINEYAK